MELVIDSNILFSALIKDSTTCELMFNESLKLFAPELMIEELKFYEDLILKKSHRSNDNFIEILYSLKEIITIIPKDDFSNFMEEAKSITPDQDDFMYFALALKLKIPIWSNDKKLKQQDKVKVYSTEEIIGKLRK